jgi:hypothetical protein
MTGFLGYDPDGLARLRRALDDLDRHGALVRTDDPAAAHALALHRSAVTAVLSFRTDIARILASAFADGSSLWLDGELPAPAGADRLDAAALATLGPQAFAALVARLAAAAYGGPGAPRDALEQLGRLGRILAEGWPSLDGPAWLGALAGLDPAALALLVRHAAVPTALLVALVPASWQAAAAGRSRLHLDPPEVDHPMHPLRGLAAALAADPVAARAVVAAWPADRRDELLVLAEPTVLGPLLDALGDPTVGDEATVGGAVGVALGLAARHPRLLAPMRPALAEMVGPWLDAVVLGAPLTATACRWTPTDPALLAWMAEDPRARQLLGAHAALLVPTRAVGLLASDDPAQHLDRLGAAVGTVQRATGEATVHVAEAALDAHERRLGLVDTAVEEALDVLPLDGAIGAAVHRAGRLIAHEWTDGGLLGAPPPVHVVERRVRKDSGEAKVHHEQAVASLVVRRLVAAGALPRGTVAPTAPAGSGPGAWAAALDRWVGSDPARARVRAGVHAFGDGFGAGYGGYR